jgi:hypothetical protein
MATGQPRQAVKRRVLTRQETLQRLRDECTDRISKDREAFRQNIRSSLKGSLEGAIRDTIRASHEEDYAPIDERDIDRLVQGFIDEICLGPDQVEDSMDPSMFECPDDDTWKVGMVKCPLCIAGWLLEPYPGIVTCDGCSDMRLSSSVQELAYALDETIRAHANLCDSKFFGFSISNQVLFFQCRTCGACSQVG